MNQNKTMISRPILFSGQMVRAILDWRKKMTRRVVKFPVIDRQGIGCEIAGCEINSYLNQGLTICPYGQPGDHLWVRETWRAEEHEDSGIYGIRFRADNAFVPIRNTIEAGRLWVQVRRASHVWRPSIFLPRWASRLTLEVKSVKVERLRDISPSDMGKEGVTVSCLSCGNPSPCSCQFPNPNPFDGFISLWDSINSKRNGGQFSWDKNPWVWAVEFKMLTL